MNPYYSDDYGTLYCGDSLEICEYLEEQYVNMIITSPPYWALRNYGVDGQLGQESTFAEYIIRLTGYFDSSWNLLKDNGNLWVNIGDTYYSKSKGSGGKSKKQLSNQGSWYNGLNIKGNELPERSLCLIPSRFAISMQDAGWVLRNDIIWRKPNQMVTSAKNRFTQDYEHLFLFTKINKDYYFEQQKEPYKSKENHKPRNKASEKYKDTELYSKGARDYYSQGGRNVRAVWDINTEATRGSKHFAKFPKKLIETPIKAGCPEGGIVMDIFFGSGTTAIVAEKLNRKWLGIELNKEYCDEAIERILKERNNGN